MSKCTSIYGLPVLALLPWREDLAAQLLLVHGSDNVSGRLHIAYSSLLISLHFISASTLSGERRLTFAMNTNYAKLSELQRGPYPLQA